MALSQNTALLSLLADLYAQIIELRAQNAKLASEANAEHEA